MQNPEEADVEDQGHRVNHNPGPYIEILRGRAGCDSCFSHKRGPVIDHFLSRLTCVQCYRDTRIPGVSCWNCVVHNRRRRCSFLGQSSTGTQSNVGNSIFDNDRFVSLETSVDDLHSQFSNVVGVISGIESTIARFVATSNGTVRVQIG